MDEFLNYLESMCGDLTCLRYKDGDMFTPYGFEGDVQVSGEGIAVHGKVPGRLLLIEIDDGHIIIVILGRLNDIGYTMLERQYEFFLGDPQSLIKINDCIAEMIKKHFN